SCVNRTIAAPSTPICASPSSFCAFVISSGGALSGRTTLGGGGAGVIPPPGGGPPPGHPGRGGGVLRCAAGTPAESARTGDRSPPARRARIIGKVNDVHDYPGTSITWPS